MSSLREALADFPEKRVLDMGEVETESSHHLCGSLLRERSFREISVHTFARLVNLCLVLSMLDPPHHRRLAVVFLGS
jgi:hypothetical protein